MTSIDLNADLGEGFGPWKMGNDRKMMSCISSANIACGGHAGDPSVMREAVEMAVESGVKIGAHPGFWDKENFGRRRLPLSAQEVERLVAYQTGALCGIASLAGAEVSYVKAHGALANWAAETPEIAAAVVRATQAVLGSNAVVLAVSGTELERAARKLGVAHCSEVFADRGYLSNGLLVPRNQPGAMIEDPEVAAARLIDFLNSGTMPTIDGANIPLTAGSICVHGDGPTAVAVATLLRTRLETAGHKIQAFCA